MIKVVTTFHPEGLSLYGQRFIDSFSSNVDKQIELIVYAENCEPKNPDPSQIKIIPQTEVVKLTNFKNKWKDIPKANGKCPWPEKRPRDYHKEFKWDAVRFANKVYAVFHAVETLDTDWVVWMDADTYVHSPITHEEFKNLLPDNKWITYVGRGKGVQTWPECGFYGLNIKNETCKKFIKEFERVYEDADNGIFKLAEWHDSFVFGDILKKLIPIDKNYLDYSEGLYNRTAKTGGGGHPLINSILGKWFDHMKGARKKQGRSNVQKDLVSKRSESYWNEI